MKRDLNNNREVVSIHRKMYSLVAATGIILILGFLDAFLNRLTFFGGLVVSCVLLLLNILRIVQASIKNAGPKVEVVTELSSVQWNEGEDQAE